jgi:hypothetical protein
MSMRPAPVDASDSPTRHPQASSYPTTKEMAAFVHRKEMAASTVQRVWRTRKQHKRGKSMLSLWPSLPALRQLYLDEQAIAAGAKNSALYTDEAIVQREMLRTHPRVVSALDYFWESIPKAEATRISKEEVRRARLSRFLAGATRESWLPCLSPPAWLRI